MTHAQGPAEAPGRSQSQLGERLVTRGIITQQILNNALEAQRRTGKRLGEILVESFYLSEIQLACILAEHLKLEYVDVAPVAFTPEQLNLVPEALARKHVLMPLGKEGRTLDLVMADPGDLDALSDISFVTGCRVAPRIGARSQILEAIDRFYARHMEGAGALMAAGQEQAADPFLVRNRATSALDAKVDAPVIQLLNLIMKKAIQTGASDIHIEPGEPEGVVRFRLDGLLVDQLQVPFQLQPALISRLKILGRMDIAEKRMPQDGSVRVTLEGRETDLRLSTIPLRGGEKAVIRILDTSSGAFALDSIGFAPEDLASVEKLIHRHMGMIIITGPTGSGKTTTLYAMLNRIKKRTINIVTVEDPIEYNYPGLNQMQVNPDIDLTFARGLRAILRQDPDVVLVGEIRDAETAEIACRAALTGHLVFSTLHTNDATSSITRLLDIGIPRYLAASVLTGIIAQRLVRRVCPDCWTATPPDPESLVTLGLTPASLGQGHFGRGLGCNKCHGMGYKGRIGVFETLVMNARLRELVLRGATEEDLRQAAQESGMRTLVEDGLQKARTGQTTLEELGRVLEVGEHAENTCGACGRLLNSEYRFCPYCRTPRLRICAQCGRPLHPGWIACAHCGQG